VGFASFAAYLPSSALSALSAFSAVKAFWLRLCCAVLKGFALGCGSRNLLAHVIWAGFSILAITNYGNFGNVEWPFWLRLCCVASLRQMAERASFGCIQESCSCCIFFQLETQRKAVFSG